MITTIEDLNELLKDTGYTVLELREDLKSSEK